MIETYDKTREIAIISPSILSADFAALTSDIQRVEGEADWLHIDVMEDRKSVV